MPELVDLNHDDKKRKSMVAALKRAIEEVEKGTVKEIHVLGDKGQGIMLVTGPPRDPLRFVGMLMHLILDHLSSGDSHDTPVPEDAP